jgi:hypothetical protein
MDSYWLKQHGEILTRQKDIEEAEHALSVLLEVDIAVLTQLDPESIRRLRLRFHSNEGAFTS